MFTHRGLSPVFPRRLLAALTALLLLALTHGALAAPRTHALVIGVDQVQGVRTSLKGASHDARDMAEQLKQRGIEPIVLLNEQATKAAITSALHQGAKADQLVVYYAGLGSGPNTPRLVVPGSPQGLTLEELDAILLEVGVDSTTVILDTSFTGSRASKSGPSLFTSRYYAPPSRDTEIRKVGADAAHLPGLSHDKVCYITAGRYNEDAFEDTFAGRPRGVFTHFLVQRLQTDQPLAWQTIQWDVAEKVAAHVDDQQHPNFPAAYLAQAAFEGKTLAPPEYQYGKLPDAPPQTPATPTQVPASRTLWTLFNVDNVNPQMVSLSMTPNRAEVAVEESLEFHLQVGKAGYLVVVEHSVEGNLVPIFPRNGDITSAWVEPGQKVTIPEPGYRAYADRSGKERLKALLFDDKAAANDLLFGLLGPTDQSVGASFGSVAQRLQSRGIRFARTADFGGQDGAEKVSGLPYTADLTFRVVQP